MIRSAKRTGRLDLQCREDGTGWFWVQRGRGGAIWGAEGMNFWYREGGGEMGCREELYGVGFGEDGNELKCRGDREG